MKSRTARSRLFEVSLSAVGNVFIETSRSPSRTTIGIVQRRGVSDVALTSLASSILLRRIIGSMFMRVNCKCAHQLSPPLKRFTGAGVRPAETELADAGEGATRKGGLWRVLSLPEAPDAVGDLRSFVAFVRELCDGEREGL